MVARILWSKEEAEILLKALLDVLAGKVKRTDAVREVSRTLRRRAVQKGRIIDYTFRNPASIALQMGILENLYTKGKNGLKITSHSVFQEVVDDYYSKKIKQSVAKETTSSVFENRNFDKNKTVAVSVNSVNYQQEYYKWLAGFLTERNYKVLCFVYAEFDSYATKNKLLNDSIFTINDFKELQRVLEIISSCIILPIDIPKKHIRQANILYLDYFKRYITDSNRNKIIISPINTAIKKQEITPTLVPVKIEKIEAVDEEPLFAEISKQFSFYQNDDLSFTKPSKLSYFGKELSCGRNWSEFYVNLIEAIMKNYPYKFGPRMSFSSGARRIDLDVKQNERLMVSPKDIPGTGYVLETNVSANNLMQKVKYIIDYCNIGYENVVIKYQRKVKGASSVSLQKKQEPTQQSVRTSVAEVQHQEIRVPAFRKDEYTGILQAYFKKGFRLESVIELRRFKRYYVEKFDHEMSETDEQITQNIRSLCIVCNANAFLPGMMLSEAVKTDLLHYIEKNFADGKQVIYYQALYNEFSVAFLDSHIYDVDVLKAYLMNLHLANLYFHPKFISKSVNVAVDLLGEVREYLQEQAQPVMLDELFAALPHIPQAKIKSILFNNLEFVNNAPKQFFHASIVELSEDDLEDITKIISTNIEMNGFIAGNELYDAIKVKYPYIIEANSVVSVQGFRDTLKYKLKGKFAFKANIISRYGEELSISDVFASYAKHHDRFTLDEVAKLAAELNTPVRLEPLYENSLRISMDEFVSLKQAQFSIEDTDAALDRICDGKYIAIQEVNNFGIFPYAGFTWNSFLLEHYVAKYSQKYLLLHNNYGSTKCTGAIVKRSAGIDNFDDLIVDILANNDVSLKNEMALQFLYDGGYLARRTYANIGQLTLRASAERNRKDKN